MTSVKILVGISTSNICGPDGERVRKQSCEADFCPDCTPFESGGNAGECNATCHFCPPPPTCPSYTKPAATALCWQIFVRHAMDTLARGAEGGKGGYASALDFYTSRPLIMPVPPPHQLPETVIHVQLNR